MHDNLLSALKIQNDKLEFVFVYKINKWLYFKNMKYWMDFICSLLNFQMVDTKTHQITQNLLSGICYAIVSVLNFNNR